MKLAVTLIVGALLWWAFAPDALKFVYHGGCVNGWSEPAPASHYHPSNGEGKGEWIRWYADYKDCPTIGMRWVWLPPDKPWLRR